MSTTVRTYPAESAEAETATDGLYSESMRFPAYLLSKSGEVIRPAVVELSDEDLPEGEVLVRVEWTAINFKDAMVTRPGNRVARKFPLVPGVELTGTVEKSSSAEFVVGRRVLVQGYDLGVAHHGGFAAYARVPADWVVPLPEALSCRNAAIIGLAGLTALLSMHRLRQHGTTVDDGPVLVTGASGGVGSAAVALLAKAGFEVVASSGKTAEHDYLKELGAAQVVGRQFTEDDGRTLGPQLWGAVVDCVGGMALAEALRTVRYGGAVAASGLTGGYDLSTTVYPFIVRGVALLGIDTVATPIEERRELWSEMAEAFPLGQCEDMVNEEIGLDGLTAALGRVLDAAVRGRILVAPNA
ncbi:MAG TPA: acryloyl-CoA reductase [Acidimicrobiales bacterium]|nr:acryloyl-CoA reductase [Acidimicrobiales bacterium]